MLTIRLFKETTSRLLALVLIILSISALLIAPEAKAEEVFTEIVNEDFTTSVGETIQAGSVSIEHVVGADAESSYLKLSNRANTWDGVDIPFAQNQMEINYNYRLKLSLSVDADTVFPDGSEYWIQIPSGSYPLLQQATMLAGEVTTIETTFAWDDPEFTQFRIQSNEAAQELGFNILSYSIEQGAALVVEPTETTAPEIVDGGEVTPVDQLITFEDGTTEGFVARGGVELLEIIDGENHTDSGSKSLYVGQREQNWHGASLNITDLLTVGQEYQFSIWVKTNSEAASTIQLSTQIGDGNTASYQNISSVTINNTNDWTEIKGSYRYDSLGDGFVSVYIESPQVDTEFYLDDFSIKSVETEAVSPDYTLTPIKDEYQDSFLIGNAISVQDLQGVMLEQLKLHHNLVTAENAMKPEALYNENGEFDFTGADLFVDTAIAEGFKVHGHVLVWHAQSPTWLWSNADGTPLSREAALQNMENHIRTVITHFGDKIMSWDVVNEALDGAFSDPENWQSSLRNSAWLNAIGDDFIYQAFKIARKVADENGLTDMTLIYNDYNDDQQNKAATMYHMIKDINEQYTAETGDTRKLISEVGMQSHYNMNTNPDNVRASIDRFRELGIEVAITELDLTTQTRDTYVQEEIDRQALLYAKLFDIYKDNADIISRVTFWGLSDTKSWRSDGFPLPFDGNLKAKPAYYAIMAPEAYIAEHDVVSEVIKMHAESNYGTPTEGSLDPLWAEQGTLDVNKYQTAWEGATATAKTLWDEENLYLLIQVKDPNLDASAEQAYEQDSVEIFVNETNEQALFYIDGVGQYRVNYANVSSFNPVSIEEGFSSQATLTDDGYLLEISIPWKVIQPEAGMTIGLDLQVNDAESGSRIAVAAWNDQTGQAYNNPSLFGELTLVRQTIETTVETSETTSPEITTTTETTEATTETTTETTTTQTTGVEDTVASLGTSESSKPSEESASTTNNQEEVIKTGENNIFNSVRMATILGLLIGLVAKRKQIVAQKKEENSNN